MSLMLEVKNLEVGFSSQPSLVQRVRGIAPATLRAVDDVSLSIERGAMLGIAGESGCGKSTVARAITGIVKPSAGSIRLDGEELTFTRSIAQRRKVQMVFQDPMSSLNPAKTIGQILSELLRVHELASKERLRQRCVELLQMVGLTEQFYDARPARMSGGQRQRVGIARALAVEPELMIADESVAALDVSLQASILNLIQDLRARLGLTVIFVSHDLAVLRNVCDRMAIMYLGRVVEENETSALFSDPRHPYTSILLGSAPRVGRRFSADSRRPLEGEPPSPLNLPPGCRFNPRCPRAVDLCRVEPPAETKRGSLRVRCHRAFEDD